MSKRRDIPARAWNEFVWRHEDGWFLHTSAWLDYAAAYTPDATDLSSAIGKPDGTILAIVPGMDAPGGIPCNGGQLPVPPLVAPGSGLKCEVGGHEKLRVAYRPGREPEEMPADGFCERTIYTFVVDLQLSEKERWSAMRRSYRGLIRSGEKRLRTTVLSMSSPEAAWTHMAQALALHTAAAGRQTRSELTWRIQSDWLVAGYGVLAMAHALDGTPVAFAYALRYKDWAYYFSGASAEDNVQHLLQWKLMEALGRDGATRFYELGHDAEPGDDAKLRNVAFFKSGFGGRRVPVTVVESVEAT
jgi:hypothetical protein